MVTGASRHRPSPGLPFGLILEIARSGGLQVLDPRPGERMTPDFRCPFHEDRKPSATLILDKNILSCFVCGTKLAHELAAKLRVDWPPPSLTRHASIRAAASSSPSRSPSPPSPPPEAKPRFTFTASDAVRTWEVCRAHALDDDLTETDQHQEIYNYLAMRGLRAACDFSAVGEPLFGIASGTMEDLPEAAREMWAYGAHRIVCALYEVETGELVNVQARTYIDTPGTPKVLNPEGSRISGTVFANARGRAVLRGEAPPGAPVLVGEGLTDFLADGAAAPWLAVLTVPGQGGAASAIGPWARGRRVILALDCDGKSEAGKRAAAERVAEEGGHAIVIEWPYGPAGREHGQRPLKDAGDVAFIVAAPRFRIGPGGRTDVEEAGLAGLAEIIEEVVTGRGHGDREIDDDFFISVVQEIRPALAPEPAPSPAPPPSPEEEDSSTERDEARAVYQAEIERRYGRPLRPCGPIIARAPPGRLLARQPPCRRLDCGWCGAASRERYEDRLAPLLEKEITIYRSMIVESAWETPALRKRLSRSKTTHRWFRTGIGFREVLSTSPLTEDAVPIGVEDRRATLRDLLLRLRRPVKPRERIHDGSPAWKPPSPPRRTANDYLGRVRGASSVPDFADTARGEGLEPVLGHHDTGPDGRTHPRACDVRLPLEGGGAVLARLVGRLRIKRP